MDKPSYNTKAFDGHDESCSYPKRKTLRWEGFDYSSTGYFFITIVVNHRRCILGSIDNAGNHLTETGKMVDTCINNLDGTFAGVDIDDYVVMPNHIHLVISNFGSNSVVEVVRRLKAKTTYLYHRMAGMINHAPTDDALWQRTYYDRVLRNQREYDFVRNYIFRNPERWYYDKLNAECYDDCDNISQILHNIEIGIIPNPGSYFDTINPTQP